MNWLKLLRHDIRSGLLRWRYLVTPVIFCLPCFQSWMQISNVQRGGTWMDYLLCCLRGTSYMLELSDFEFPILWFLVMGGCLFLSLDYPLNDLTEAGQQVIIRSVNKKTWFFSKCAWNLMSSTVYFLLGMLTALVFALASGGSASLDGTYEVLTQILYTAEVPTVGQAVMVATVLPWLTIAALNMLQMTLTLVMKPIFSFLACVSVLITSMFICSPFMLGNGAMVIRSSILDPIGVEPLASAFMCIVVIATSVIVGMIRFNCMDHLRYEE